MPLPDISEILSKGAIINGYIVVTTMTDKREKSKVDLTAVDLSQADTFYLRVFTVAIRDVRFHGPDKRPAIESGIALRSRTEVRIYSCPKSGSEQVSF